MRFRLVGLLLLLGLVVAGLSSSWIAASESKPSIWSPVGAATTNPEWSFFWNHARFVVPFWGGRVGEADLITGLRPTVNGNPTVRISELGRVINADTADRLIYAVGSLIGFDKDVRWSVGVIAEFRDLSSDQQTAFGKSSETPTNGAPRQLFLQIVNSGNPSEVELEVDEEPGGNTVYITTAAVINENVPYLFITTQDGAEGLTLYIADLSTKSLVVDGDTGTQSANVDTSQDLHLLAHFSDTNDDLDGELSFFWYLDGYTMNSNQVRQMVVDPFGMLRMVEDEGVHSIQDAVAAPQVIIIGWAVPDWLAVVISNLGLAKIGG